MTFNETSSSHSTLINRMVVQVLKKCDNWERRTGYFRQKRSKNEIHLLGQCWERQTTSLIAFIFGVLVNVEKKIVCLQCRFKSWHEILTVVMTSYYENVCLCKRYIVVHPAFCFWWFALLFLGLTTHYLESWFKFETKWTSALGAFWQIHIQIEIF